MWIKIFSRDVEGLFLLKINDLSLLSSLLIVMMVIEIKICTVSSDSHDPDRPNEHTGLLTRTI